MTDKERFYGTIQKYISDKGFGFIKPEVAGQKDIFFHITEVVFDKTSIEEGMQVGYFTKEGKKGLVAYEVDIVPEIK